MRTILSRSMPRTSALLLVLASCGGDDGDDDTGADSVAQTDTSGDPITDPTTDTGRPDETGDPSDTVADTSADTSADTTTEDPFAACERGVLEPDLMSQDMEGNFVPIGWFGAGVDPETGELVDDGSTYVVSATYLTLRPEPDAEAAFGEVMGPIIPALYGNPGLVASQLGVSMSCATARTFTVWRDEAAMMAFVTSAAHGAAVARIGEISRGASLVTHWTEAPVAEITWEVALQRLEQDEGPLY